MATNEVEIQPVQDHSTKEPALPIEDIVPEQEQAPTEKSGVYVDPFAPPPKSRFNKRDRVHMSIIENGTRTKGSFKISKAHYNRQGSFWEYQLLDARGNLYERGAWIRERLLKSESS